MSDPLVSDLMTEPVLTVSPADTAGEVAAAMAQERIKSVVAITDDCAVEGIFTATDYMHLAAEGTDPAATSVGECMTTGVVTVEPDDDAAAAAGLMAEHDISHLPVVEDDQVVGMVTSTDLVPSLAEE